MNKFKRITTAMTVILILSAMVQVIPIHAISSPTLDDYSVQVGQEVEVSGEDVTAGSTVKVYWSLVKEPFSDGAGLLTSTEGNPDGSFEVEVTIPETRGGTNYIWVKDVGSGDTAKSSMITVLPKISATPHRSLPGYTIDMEGYSFLNDTEITLRLFNSSWSDELSTSPSKVETDDLGSFEASFQVPSISHGDYELEAEDEFANNAIIDFTIGASITLSEEEGPSGSKVTVEGVGFTPDDTITDIEIDGVDVEIVGGEIDVEGDGEFDGYIVIPSLNTGKYTIIVSDGSVWADAEFEVDGETEIKLSPSSGPPGTKITVKGYNFTQISDTDVEIWRGSQLIGTAETDSDGTFTDTFNIPGLSSGDYTIKVEDDYGLTAEATLKVGFVLAILSVSEGPSGERVPLTGVGFNPGDFDAYFDDILVIERGDVNSEGMISDSFYVPTISPGTYTVTIIDEDDNEASEDFEVTDKTKLKGSSNFAPVEYIITFTGEYFSQDEGAELEWEIYNETWDEDITGDVEYEGSMVEVTEDGNFTAEWVIPDDLVMGETYTINATDENDLWAATTLTIVEKQLEISTKLSSYALGETITFTIQSSFREPEAYLRILDPEGDIYYQSTFQEVDWFETGDTWYVPVRAQFDDVSGNPFTVSSSAPTGEWTWTFYDSEDDKITSGSFKVFQTSSEQVGERLNRIEESIEDLQDEVLNKLRDLELDILEAKNEANDAKEAAEDAGTLIESIENDAESAKIAAEEAKNSADGVKSTVNEIRLLVYISIVASIVAAIVSFAPIIQKTRITTIKTNTE